MNELERFRTAPFPSATRELVTTGSQDLSLQAILFKALYGFSKQTKGMNMLYNLQAAAFHLSFMLKGYTVNDKLVNLLSFLLKFTYFDYPQAIPNIPDSYDALYNAWVSFNQYKIYLLIIFQIIGQLQNQSR
jgi:uncharacterized protein YbcC (UPF0753/DUF2309 family)